MKYRSKPKIIEAFQWFPNLIQDVVMFDPKNKPYVTTIHGQITYVEAGDFIITEPDGIHHYPCKPEIFVNSYEKVD